MYIARRMLVNEFKSDEAFIAKDAAGKPRIFCVEHESGRTIPGLSWTEAVAEAKQLNEECAMMLLA
jgi:hypothetical protein